MIVGFDQQYVMQAGDEHALLTASGLLDETFYRSQVRLAARVDAVRHYLEIGWQWGLQPRADFESAFLQPYYEAAGLPGPPLLIWLELIARGGGVPCTEGEARLRAESVRASPLFDSSRYASLIPEGMDPALHYVLVGECLGWRPSQSFDPAFYVERYPDIPAIGMSPLLHFEHYGCREGRRGRAAAERLSYPALPTTNGKRKVLVMAHEATRTGAPILSWSIAKHLAKHYDVVSVLFKGGELEGHFAAISAAVVGPLTWDEWHPVEMDRIAARVVGAYGPLYAVSNSIETNLLVPPLAKRGVPSIALVHEFAAYTRPVEKMSNVFDWATDVVFPAHIVAQSSFKFFPHLNVRRGVHVFAQGRVDPPAQQSDRPAPNMDGLAVVTPPEAEGDAFMVLGVGYVDLRKGVDIFLSIAAYVRRIAPELKVRFVWIGDGYDPLKDSQYSAYLAEQYDRADLAGMVVMLPPVPDLDPVYAAADLFLMCSRLDPQPNVGIDSVVRGLPVVCFEDGSGTAEVLASDPETRALVAPYLDAYAAAGIICQLARDPEAHAAMRRAVQRVARQAYDMDAYMARLNQMGRAAAAMLREEDRLTLLESGVLDLDLVLPPGETAPGLDGVAHVVLQQWAVVGASPGQTANAHFRRPCAGFHPQAYAAAHPEACLEGGQNPLAHWLRAGRPPGHWSREVIEPLTEPARSPLRIALHAHFYYTSAAMDLEHRLAGNITQCSLFLTTDTAAKAQQLRAVFAGHRGEVDVAVVPNRGRDMGPFLDCLKRAVFVGYDVVGHVHGKRSQETDEHMGDRWREFLWENLIGGTYPMLDTVADAFASRPNMGLLMADDPHIVGWDANRATAESIAARIGLTPELDTFFDFPLGNMFWARPDALSALLTLNLAWDDYPLEPVPYDGTILHALERLIPFVVRSACMTIASVRVPGTAW